MSQGVDQTFWARFGRVGTAILTWITALGLLGTLLLGVWNSRQERISRDWDRMQKAAEELGSSSPHERLAGVMGVSSFLSSSRDQRTQAELTLANALGIEESESVRDAIVASFERIDSNVGQTELDWITASLVRVSQGLMTEGNLWLSHSDPSCCGEPRDASPEARAVSVALAITALVHKGSRLRDLSRSFLARRDFSNLNLAGVNFDDSILSNTDFSNSVLTNGSFEGADLDSTRFVAADLRHAKFTIASRSSASPRWNYELRRFIGKEVPSAFEETGPEFNCADLRYADFSGHPVFFLASDDAPVNILPPQFVQANLDHADFRSAKVYGVIGKVDERYFTVILGAMMRGDFEVVWGDTGSSFGLATDHSERSLTMMRDAFYGSNWRSAQLPQAVLEVFGKALFAPAEKAAPDLNATSMSCTPRVD
jgi:uncharacterized protein YjbI with pentapeptide repeats